jgi:hypothetical protein
MPSDEIEAHAWTRHEAAAGLATTPDLDIVLARAFAIVEAGRGFR